MFDFDLAQAIRNFSISFVPFFLALILHEVSHAYVAWRLGDPTAKLDGRITMNPAPHIDPLGLVAFVVTGMSGGLVFGWAKPVPIDPGYMKDPKKGMMLVSLAGPVANFLMALAFAAALGVAIRLMPPYLAELSSTQLFVLQVLQSGVLINLCLGFFNLLPVPPLDGSKVLAYFLPARTAWSFMSAGRYGFFILLALIISGMLDKILNPLVRGGYSLILNLIG